MYTPFLCLPHAHTTRVTCFMQAWIWHSEQFYVNTRKVSFEYDHSNRIRINLVRSGKFSTNSGKSPRSPTYLEKSPCIFRLRRSSSNRRLAMQNKRPDTFGVQYASWKEYDLCAEKAFFEYHARNEMLKNTIHSSVCVPWLVTAHSYLWPYLFTQTTRRIHMSDMTRSDMTRSVMSHMTHSYGQHDSFIYVTWLW